MTELTLNDLEALDERVAIHVMHWHVEERQHLHVAKHALQPKGPCWVDEEGESHGAVGHWSPTQQLADAMTVFAACPDMVLGHNPEGGYRAVVQVQQRGQSIAYVAPAVTLELAIVVAALRRAGVAL